MQNFITLPALAVDCSGNQCLLALALQGGQVVEKTIAQPHGHASFLLPEILAFLSVHQLALSSLKTLCVVTGPGGFTGIRVGLSFARVLAKLTPLTVLGVNAFHLHAAQSVVTFPTTLLIDTRRGDSFAQKFDAQGHAVGEPFLSPEPAPEPVLSLAPVFGFALTQFVPLTPIYLREADTSQAKHNKPFTIAE